MITKIDEKKRKQMFRAFQEKQSIAYVSRSASVAQATARRYRKIDRWDERLKNIQEKARERMDSKDAQRLVEIITDVSEIRTNIIAAMKQRFPADADETSKPSTFFDLDKIIRLEQYLRGHPDARQEHVLDPLQALIGAVREFDEKKGEKGS